MKIRTIIMRRKRALKSAKPAERDRLRAKLKVALVAQQLRKENAA